MCFKTTQSKLQPHLQGVSKLTSTFMNPPRIPTMACLIVYSLQSLRWQRVLGAQSKLHYLKTGPNKSNFYYPNTVTYVFWLQIEFFYNLEIPFLAKYFWIQYSTAQYHNTVWCMKYMI